MASVILDEPRLIEMVAEVAAMLVEPWPVIHRIRIEPGPECYLTYSTGKRLAQEQRRTWRTKQRALELRPLSDKVVYPRRMVDVAVVKKGRPK